MLNVFRSRYSWTMWLGALITSLLFVAEHMQQCKLSHSVKNGAFV
ncbi:hypothetical protein ACS228_23520 (plasmid) [Escherichia coli]